MAAGFMTGATAILALDSGEVFSGQGFGAEKTVIGELCFNTSMTGHQEILTDPSYAQQIVSFTFPHIGITGANAEDEESSNLGALGCVFSAPLTAFSNWRAQRDFSDWLRLRGQPAISGIDTRRLTLRIRERRPPRAALAHARSGRFDLDALRAQCQKWPGLEGMELADSVSCKETFPWNKTARQNRLGSRNPPCEYSEIAHIVAIDYGTKQTIFRHLTDQNLSVTVVPARTSAQSILQKKPKGVFLSNGPGDPAATAEWAVPILRELLDSGIPMFGICLGCQLLALALGGRTEKMKLGHRGGNHPVQELKTGRVEITAQNHGFVITKNSLPDSVRVTHKSLFDGSIEGFRLDGAPVFGVQFHPESSPGPSDSLQLFAQFARIVHGANYAITPPPR